MRNVVVKHYHGNSGVVTVLLKYDREGPEVKLYGGNPEQMIGRRFEYRGHEFRIACQEADTSQFALYHAEYVQPERAT